MQRRRPPPEPERSETEATEGRTGQTHVPKYHESLLRRIESGEIDPSFVVTHTVPLERGPEMYRTFREKDDGCIKVVLKPWES